ncbi:MAG: hypothetical protein ACOZB0_09950 [Pseudomonadota bacterium]
MIGLLRGLAYLWAAPNSLLGVLGGLDGRGWRVRRGVLEIADAWLPKVLGAQVQAVTLGHVILARDARALGVWREHERMHVRQYEWLGPLFLPAYGLLGVWTWLRGRHPYREHPLEVESGRRSLRGMGGREGGDQVPRQ